jgi:gas vesicle protein
MAGFIIGVVIGAILGVLLLCLCRAARDESTA